MGIPKFYRWISERYPLVNQPIASTSVPVIDNLYLDMNGIIHNCTHGNEPGRKLTETEMVLKVFQYLEKLFEIVQPQKLLFMAIDGVAPRAKMNQQRSRRFKARKEAAEAAAAAARKGEPLPADAFDSNCITPGTEFMERLGAHLRFFLRRKTAEDEAWRRPTIIFSGHEVPGEGEHKIMEHLRAAKGAPGYAPNQRHCMYGLDADLIMLALVTHEPHFCLLREVVRFGGGARGQPAREVLDNPCADHFILLQIGLLRDYLDVEFAGLALPFGYDVERVIDDFVLFCMLIGNDFLPTLPTLDIHEGALDKIFALYKELLPSTGYLTEAGHLHARRLEALLARLARLERDTLEQRAADAESFESRRNKDTAWQGPRGAARANGHAGTAHFPMNVAGQIATSNGRGRPASEGHSAVPSRWLPDAADELDPEDAFEGKPDGAPHTGLRPLRQAEAAAAGLGQRAGDPAAGVALLDLEVMAALEGGGAEDGTRATMMSRGARDLLLSGNGEEGLRRWKERYMREKLGIHPGDPVARRHVVECYTTGLRWVLEYYYRGVASWDWFYPYYYAPLVSEMVGLPSGPAAWPPSRPFLPFQQLLAVLPSASAQLLPAAYQVLMLDTRSPIKHLYPEDFRVDCEGKRAEWEGVVLVPFIDEAALLSAEALIPPEALSPAERARNRLGPMLVFTARAEGAPEEGHFCASTLPGHFASLSGAACASRCEERPPYPPLAPGQPGFLPRTAPGTKRPLPGYPTLKTLAVSSELRAVGVNVLGQASKGDSVILKNELGGAAEGRVTAAMVASAVIGQRCWIRWPYLQEALVQAVSDRAQKVEAGGAAIEHAKDAVSVWSADAARLEQTFLTKQGLDVGRCNLLLHVRPCEGLIRQLDGSVEKRFAKSEVLYPIQATLRRNPAPDPRLDEAAAAAALGALAFQVGEQALYLGRAHYGCVATILPDISPGLSKTGAQLPAINKPGETYHVSVAPAPPAAASAAATAKRIIAGVKVAYFPSGQVARKLGISPRTLGKITGNLFVEGSEGRLDLGLAVKSGGQGLSVPDYVQALPDEKGWAYSDALAQVLAQYKARHAWVFQMLEASPEGRDYRLAEALVGLDPDARAAAAAAVRAWLKSLPLARRPLVKASAQVVPEAAVQALQAALAPGPSRALPMLELENVSPALLLPPSQARLGLLANALAGGAFELGDRVACSRKGGAAPLGARGTVVGLHDDAAEVLFDAEIPGGTDLFGRCRGKCGAIMPPDHLLNLTKPHAVATVGQTAPRAAPRAPVPALPATLSPSPPKKPPPFSASAQQAAASSKGLAVRLPSVRALIQPLDPPSPRAKGFSVGRGRPLAPALDAVSQSPGPGAPPPPAISAATIPNLKTVALPAKLGPSGLSPPPPNSTPPAATTPAPAPLAPPPPFAMPVLQTEPTHHGASGQAAGRDLLFKLQAGQAPSVASAAPPGAGRALLEQLKRGPALQPRPEPTPGSEPRRRTPQPTTTSVAPASAAAQAPPDGQALGRNLLAGLHAHSLAAEGAPTSVQQPPPQANEAPAVGFPPSEGAAPPAAPLNPPPADLGTNLLLKLQRAGPFANPQAPSLLAGQEWGRHILSHLQGNHPGAVGFEDALLGGCALTLPAKGWDEHELLARLQRVPSGGSAGATPPPGRQPPPTAWPVGHSQPGAAPRGGGGDEAQAGVGSPHGADALHRNSSMGSGGGAGMRNALVGGLPRKPSEQQLQRGRKLLDALTSGRSVGAMAATQLPARPPGLGTPSGEASPMAPPEAPSHHSPSATRASSLASSLAEGRSGPTEEPRAGPPRRASAAKSPLGSGHSTPHSAAAPATPFGAAPPPNQGTLSAVARALRDVTSATPPAPDSPARSEKPAAAPGHMSSELAATALEAVKAALRPPVKPGRRAAAPALPTPAPTRKPDDPPPAPQVTVKAKRAPLGNAPLASAAKSAATAKPDKKIGLLASALSRVETVANEAVPAARAASVDGSARSHPPAAPLPIPGATKAIAQDGQASTSAPTGGGGFEDLWQRLQQKHMQELEANGPGTPPSDSSQPPARIEPSSSDPLPGLASAMAGPAAPTEACAEPTRPASPAPTGIGAEMEFWKALQRK